MKSGPDGRRRGVTPGLRLAGLLVAVGVFAWAAGRAVWPRREAPPAAVSPMPLPPLPPPPALVPEPPAPPALPIPPPPPEPEPAPAPAPVAAPAEPSPAELFRQQLAARQARFTTLQAQRPLAPEPFEDLAESVRQLAKSAPDAADRAEGEALFQRILRQAVQLAKKVPPPPPPPPVTPEQAAAAKRFGERLAALEEKLAALPTKASPAEAFGQLAAARELAEAAPDPAGRAAAGRVVDRLSVRAGELVPARQAFFASALVQGEAAALADRARGASAEAAALTRDLAAAKTILDEANNLHNAENYPEELAFCDYVIEHYGHTSQLHAAYLRKAQYFARTDRPAEAVQLLERAVAEAAEPETVKRAYTALANLHFNHGAKDQAIADLEHLIERVDNPRARAFALLQIGNLQEARGAPYYPSAVSALERLKREYPDSGYCGSAEAILARIKAKAPPEPAAETGVTF